MISFTGGCFLLPISAYICCSAYMKQFAHTFLVSLSLFITVIATAQIKFSVIPGKMVIQQNETVELQFVVEGTTEVTDFTPPVFRNFELVSGMNQTNGWTWVNGALSEYISYSFMLRPTIKGKLPIASAIIKVNGKTYTTKPITIQVTNAVSPSVSSGNAMIEEKPDYYLAPGESAKDKINKNLFVKVSVDKKSCYVGEPLLATFQLFTRLESESKIVKRPSLNGFSVIDIAEPEAGIFSKEKLNGKLFNCYLIRKVQLFPLQAGLLSIEPMEVENIVRFIKAVASTNHENKNWLDAIMDKMQKADITSADILEEKVILQTEEVKVNVLELPEKDKPQNFDGAVGELSIAASLAKSEIASNENGNLRITISGAGNVSMIPVPEVQWPAGLESFSAKTNEELDKTGSTLKGVKTFDIPFTAAAPGVYQIPSVSFSYFDYRSKQYKTVRSDSLQITVNNTIAKVEQPKQEYKIAEPVSLFDNELMWKIAGAVMLLLAAVIILLIAKKPGKTKKKQQEVMITEPVEVKKPAAEFLRPAMFVKDGQQDKKFCSYLLKGVQDFIADRLNINSSVPNNDILISSLEKNEMKDEAVQLEQIIKTCEEVMFSPFELQINRDGIVKEAELLMQMVDTKQTA
jgi:BatD DUF11 like domain